MTKLIDLKMPNGLNFSSNFQGFVFSTAIKDERKQWACPGKYNSGAPGHRNGVVGSCGFNIRDDATYY